MAKKKQCLCGYAFGNRDQPIVCGEHYQELVEDRDAWRKIAEELLGHLERHRRFSAISR